MSDKHAVLGILRNEELHGYEISQRLKNIEGFWYIFPGNLYKALKSLEQDGLIREVRTEEHSGKIRKIYGITESGRREFEDWVSQPATMPRTRHEGYLKIWFSSGSRDELMVQFKNIKTESERLLGLMENFDFSKFPDHIRWMMEAGRKHVSIDVEWAENVLKILNDTNVRREVHRNAESDQ